MNEEPAAARPGHAAGGQNHPRSAGRLTRFVPVLSWAPAYKPAWLTRDAIAGFTIWGLLIPEMIAYASLAGLPPQAGLYTLLAFLSGPAHSVLDSCQNAPQEPHPPQRRYGIRTTAPYAPRHHRRHRGTPVQLSAEPGSVF